MTWISDSRPARLSRSTAPPRTVAIAFALAVGLALGGCTGDKGAPPASTGQAPPPTSSPATTEPVSEPTASRPPAPDPPEPSEEIAGEDELAAIAAAEYFLDSYNYALTSGTVEIMTDLSSPGCESCASLASSVQAAYADGGWQEGGALNYGKPEIASGIPAKDHFTVQFDALESAAIEYDALGNISREFPASTSRIQLVVTKVEAGWRVTSAASGDR